MKKLLSLSLVIAFGFIAMTSCNKYEEGPSFSLLPKKMRLTGEYKIDKYVDSDGNETTSNDNSTITIEKDGTYRVSSSGFSFEGTWEWADNKESLKVSYEIFGSTTEETSKIVRLTNKELWTEDENGNQTHMTKL